MGGDVAGSDWDLIRAVSIHASAWEATSRRPRPEHTRRFQSTPPRGRRQRRSRGRVQRQSFNPRLRVGGDLRRQLPPQALAFVSIHASAWEATSRIFSYGHGGGVSIHASAWEASEISIPMIVRIPVSIHASAWEATPAFCVAIWMLRFNPRLRVGGDAQLDFVISRPYCFNPRLRVGGDLIGVSILDKIRVSIHASAWEATPPMQDFAADAKFQSTPPRGRRRSLHNWAARRRQVSIHASAWEATRSPRKGQFPSARFQSTPPRGRRRFSRGYDTPHELGFNPRLRVGGDGTDLKKKLAEIEFQSTPPRGRRRRHRFPVRGRRGFNPRLRVGGDIVFSPFPPWTISFNPRLRVGGDSCSRSSRISITLFQSTPPRGRRHLFILEGFAHIVFQSTPPRGRRLRP